MTATSHPTPAEFNDAVRAEFVSHLPRIEAHARYATRHIGCLDIRDELIAETLALAWKHFAALARRGKRPGTFVTTLRGGAARPPAPAAASPARTPPWTRCRRSRRARHGFRVRGLGRRVPVRTRGRRGGSTTPSWPRRWRPTRGRGCPSRPRSGWTSRRGGRGSGPRPGGARRPGAGRPAGRGGRSGSASASAG